MMKKLLAFATAAVMVFSLAITVSAEKVVFEKDFKDGKKEPFFANSNVVMEVKNGALVVTGASNSWFCPGIKLADAGMKLGGNYAVTVTGKILCELKDNMHISVGVFSPVPAGDANQYPQLAGVFSEEDKDLGNETGNFTNFNADGTFEITAYFNGGFLNSKNYKSIDGILPQGGYNKSVTDYEFYTIKIVELSADDIAKLTAVPEVETAADTKEDTAAPATEDAKTDNVSKDEISADKPATTETTSDKLAAPVVKAQKSSSKIKLSWEAVEGAYGYRVYLYNAETGKYTVKETIKKGTQTQVIFTDLEQGTYKYKVAAVEKTETGLKNGEVSKTVTVKIS